MAVQPGLCRTLSETKKDRFSHDTARISISGISTVFLQKDANGIANSENPDETAPQSDLGLHYLPRPECLKTWDHYGSSECTDQGLQSVGYSVCII